jgi:hypothetical protein
MPHTMVGLVINGIWLMAHGSPPIFAQIYIRILLQMLLTFLPFAMVFVSTTYEGTGIELMSNRLSSSYSGALFF